MKNNKGFTLIELLVVIAIIGVLSSLAVVSLNDARLKARDARRKSDVSSVQTALQIYYDNNGGYPNCSCYSDGAPTRDCWETALNEALLNESDKPYISPVPIDPKDDDEYYYTYCSDDGLEFSIDYVLETDGEVNLVRGF